MIAEPTSTEMMSKEAHKAERSKCLSKVMLSCRHTVYTLLTGFGSPGLGLNGVLGRSCAFGSMDRVADSEIAPTIHALFTIIIHATNPLGQLILSHVATQSAACSVPYPTTLTPKPFKEYSLCYWSRTTPRSSISTT